MLTDEALHSLIDASKELTTGWKQRLTSLLPSVDPEQVMAKLRTDGATWFVPDFGQADDSDGERSDDERSDVDLTDDMDAEHDASGKKEPSGDIHESADIDSEYMDDDDAEDAEEDESDD